MAELGDEWRDLELQAGSSLKDYGVQKAIGKGKFSVVYRGVRHSDNLPVAIKKIVIGDMMDERQREKCLKEVRLLQSLHHPQIIQYLDSFLAGTDLVIVFEWAEAGDLKRQIRKAIKRDVLFEERVVWKYFYQMAEAVRYMHANRVMHRDLKPANVFLTADARIKVGDLGLGRAFSENTLEAFSKVGTPLYMSPQVLQGKGYEWSSDVWSLGCILYELAALKSPFKEEGLNLYGLFQKISKGMYAALPDIYSSELKDLVARMLSLNPAERPDMPAVCTVAKEMLQRTAKTRVPSASSVTSFASQASRAEDEEVDPRPTSMHDLAETAAARPPRARVGVAPALAAIPNEADLKSETASPAEPGDSYWAAFALNDSVTEKLRILDYESCFCLPKSRPLFSKLHFIGDGKNSELRHIEPPPTKFQIFVELLEWLFTLAGDKLAADDAYRQPASVCAQIMLKLSSVGTRSELLAAVNVGSLRRGQGFDCLLVLDYLLDAVLTRRGFLWGSLKYEDETDITAWPDVDEESLAEVTEPAWPEAISGDKFDLDSSAVEAGLAGFSMIVTEIEPSAWYEECKRVLPQLKAALLLSLQLSVSLSSSYGRQTAWRDAVTAIAADCPRTESGLSRVAELVESDVAALRALEASLAASTEGLQEAYRACQSSNKVLSLETETMQLSIAVLSSDLAAVMEKASTVIEEMEVVNAVLKDSDPLKRIKAAAASLRKEVAAMDLRIGVAGGRLLRLRASHTTTDGFSSDLYEDLDADESVTL